MDGQPPRGGDDAATAVKFGGCSGAPIDADWPQPVPQKEALWYQAAAVERQLGLDIGVRAEVQARVRGRRIVAFEVAFGFSRLEDAALAASVDDLIDALRNGARIVTHVDQGGLDSVESTIHEVADVMPWEGLPVDLAEPRIRAPIDDAIAVFVVGNVLRDPAFDVAALAARLEAAPDTALLGPTVRRWDGPLAPDLAPLPATLAAAALVIRPPAGDASLLMLASFRMWEWLERSTAARRTHRGAMVPFSRPGPVRSPYADPDGSGDPSGRSGYSGSPLPRSAHAGRQRRREAQSRCRGSRGDPRDPELTPGHMT